MRVGMPTAVREIPRVRERPAPEGQATPFRLRPGRVVAYAWILAGVPIAALQAAHAGIHERDELPPLLHWLRDASLAVPVAAFALTVAALVVIRAFPVGSRRRGSLAAAAGLGFVAAGVFALLAMPLAQVHGLLFGAEETGMTPVQHALTEGIAVFQVALLLVPVALVAGVPWQDIRPGNSATESRAAVDGGDR